MITIFFSRPQNKLMKQKFVARYPSDKPRTSRMSTVLCLVTIQKKMFHTRLASSTIGLKLNTVAFDCSLYSGRIHLFQ